MQNPILECASEQYVRSFSSDYEDSITLIGHDERTPDFYELPYGNPDSVRYHVHNIVRHSFVVTGFVFKHPHGATISGNFAKPIIALARTLETDGEEIDSEDYQTYLEVALVAKLGRIGGLAEVNLI